MSASRRSSGSASISARASIHSAQAVEFSKEAVCAVASSYSVADLRGRAMSWRILSTHTRRAKESNHVRAEERAAKRGDRKSTRLNSSHVSISYAVFCLTKKYKVRARETAVHEYA